VGWGYTNPTAAVVFGLNGDDRSWQLDEFYQRRAPLDAVVLPAPVELTHRYRLTCWNCGPDEPEHIGALRDALPEAQLGFGCSVSAADDRECAGIQTITRLLSKRQDGTRGLYVAPRCVHTVAEYASSQYPPSDDPGTGAAGMRGTLGLAGLAGTSGAEVSELPLKANDHALDAARYALHSARNPARDTEAYLHRRLYSRLALQQQHQQSGGRVSAE
jgi:hypothetical protein